MDRPATRKGLALALACMAQFMVVRDFTIVKVVATSLDHLARVVEERSLSGTPATSMVCAKLTTRHMIP